MSAYSIIRHGGVEKTFMVGIGIDIIVIIIIIVSL